MSVGEYSAKFEELIRYFPYAELELYGRSKCVKFEMGLRPELRVTFGHEEISDFPTLVNKCRMCEDNVRMREAAARKENPPRHYGPQRNFSHGKGKGKMFQEERKPYSPPTGSRSHTLLGFSLERELSRLSESGLAWARVGSPERELARLSEKSDILERSRL
ncbi:hypothetical protein Lal_00045280 [Lupinus albus]|nr:hypothetical protein Lal_00045280 [Lupinus albus]